MPFLIPVAAAGIGAAVSGGMAQNQASNEQKSQAAQALAAQQFQAAQAASAQQFQAQQAEAARQAAMQNAQMAINSPDAMAARSAQGSQQAFANAVLPQNLQDQSQLTAQLQAATQGQGPKLAQDMLNQATGQNIASQAALMAGQRGAGANSGLIARQIGQQGAAVQQGAIGQSAILNANQQLAARQQLMQQLAGQQSAGLQAQQGAANTALGQYGSIVSALTGASQQGTQASLNAMSNTNSALNNAASNTNSALINAASNSNKSNMQANDVINKGIAGGINAVGTGLGTINFASGGPVSKAGQFIHGLLMADGGKVPALVSPGEVYLNPKKVKEVAKGKASPMSGEKIKGKAKVKGNSYANDTVSKNLDQGGIVLPRSVTQAKNPGREAAKFVTAILNKKALK